MEESFGKVSFDSLGMFKIREFIKLKKYNLLHKDWDDDSDIVIDDDNFFKMKFNTYPISFGKDYRYRVCRVAKVKGEEILNDDCDYSRWQVGNGQPKWDFCQRLCDIFREKGHTFYQGLFTKPNRITEP